MEFDLKKSLFPTVKLPTGYRLFAWNEGLIEAHADTKFRSFRFEVDANVFPCLGDREGCNRLMNEISNRSGFSPMATWLLGREDPSSRLGYDYCGTVQGICDRYNNGSIQNLGITPEHRGLGLGTLLLHEALAGFCEFGMPKATLEVTAQNSGALRLYERLGFRTVKTVYKAVDVAYA